MLETCVFAKLFEWRKYLFRILCKILCQAKIFQFLLTVIKHYQNSTFLWSIFYYVYILTWTKMLTTDDAQPLTSVIYLLYLTLVYKIVKNNSTNKYQQYQVKI